MFIYLKIHLKLRIWIFFFVLVEHISVYMDFEQPYKNIITRA